MFRCGAIPCHAAIDGGADAGQIQQSFKVEGNRLHKGGELVIDDSSISDLFCLENACSNGAPKFGVIRIKIAILPFMLLLFTAAR